MIQSADPSARTDPLRSVHTSNLLELSEQLRISLVVSTYQAGKVIVVHNDKGWLKNSAKGSGGGLSNYGSLNSTNSTISGNRAPLGRDIFP